MTTMAPQQPDRGPAPTIPSSRRCWQRRSKRSRLTSPTSPVSRRCRRPSQPTPARPRAASWTESPLDHVCLRALSVDPVLNNMCVGRAGKKDKGLTLEEVESAEGGVVRESAVGMAQTKRAARRKGKQAKAIGASCALSKLIQGWPCAAAAEAAAPTAGF